MLVDYIIRVITKEFLRAILIITLQKFYIYYFNFEILILNGL